MSKKVVKKIVDKDPRELCESCNGLGMSGEKGCPVCDGSGRKGELVIKKINK